MKVQTTGSGKCKVRDRVRFLMLTAQNLLLIEMCAVKSQRVMNELLNMKCVLQVLHSRSI